MKIQSVSNVRQQNFGNVAVLEYGDKITWLDLDKMVESSPCRKDWFITSDKARLLISNESERGALDQLSDALRKVSLGHSQKISERLCQCVKEFGQRVKPVIVNSVEDLRSIKGFEALV